MAVDHAFRKLIRGRITKLGRDEYGFTPAEVRVLTEICFGEPVSRIAEKLKMAPGTVSTHIRSMFKRSGIHARAKLISKTLLELLCGEIRGK
ncbi:MAG: LuxR C-terminal-related transcriptional regulator [Planctomycetota bacterium]|nr:LuxR C-terminal-related transcriptional regulator [Planctomycetota bacterium]